MRAVAIQTPQTKTTIIKLWGAGEHFNYMDGIRLIAAPLIATTSTHEPFLVSGHVFALSLPWLLFTPIRGALVEGSDCSLAI